jgi:hypothetical protein
MELNIMMDKKEQHRSTAALRGIQKFTTTTSIPTFHETE